ncbi:MAG: hypothetical protein QW645_04315 [Candidatus Bathyarchaeia archaeon]
MSDEELEELRRRRMAELQGAAEEERRRAQLRRRLEEERQALLRQAIVAGPAYIELDFETAGKIPRFNVLSGRLGTDDFPLSSEIEVIADVSLYDPSDRKREKPLMTWEGIDARYSYVSDARRVIQMSTEDAYEEALRSLARQIVFAVITQRPTKIAPGVLTVSGPVPPGTPQRIPGATTLDTRFLDTVTTTTDLTPETEPAKGRK